MLKTLLAKELREQQRTSKLLIFLAVLLISGLISPVLAKYTPELLRSIPDMPAALADIIPEPTLNDAAIQYVKNVSQFGVLLVIVLNMGIVAQERERSTAAMLLTKPVNRTAVVLSKWLVGMLLVAAGVTLAGIGCALYTAVLFESLPLREFLLLNALMVLFFGVYLSITVLASTIARTQSMAAAGSFGGLVLLLILGAIPRINEYMPGQLLAWGQSALLGANQPSWGAFGVALALIVLTMGSACLYFNQAEI